MAVVEEGAAPDGVILFDSDGNILSSGTTLSGTTITDGGSMVVADQGTADTTTVSSGGKMYVSSGGVANSTTVVFGYMYISSGGIANSTTVADGNMYICGVANSTEVYNWGSMYIENGGVANSTTVDFGYMYISNGGVANSTTVSVYGSMYIENGGVANSTTLAGDYIYGDDYDYRAFMHISSGGVANSTTVNEYSGMYISNGGVHRGSLQLNAGAVVSAYEGSTIDFTLTDRTPEDGYLINDLSLIKGSPTYTITVSANQGVGTYKLAQGASSFTGSITIGTETETYGTLTVNGAELKHQEATYSLVKEEGNLLLKIDQPAVFIYSSGTLVSSGSVVTGETLVEGMNDSMHISSGGVALETTVSSGGQMTISSGGVANSTTVNEGGSMYISSGGVANSTTVNQWGSMYISSGGVANSTTVDYGAMSISSGGVANNTTVDYGHMYIEVGGVANSTTVNGYMFISSGGVANSTTVSSGGQMTVESGGVANSTTVNGWMYISSGGVANSVLLNSGMLEISSGGVANNTTVNEDGCMYVSSGGVANRVLLDNYTCLSIESGGTASIVYNPFYYGDISCDDGAVVEYVEHAAIYFGSNTGEGDTELVSKSNETLENHTIKASHIVAVAENGIANNTVVEGGFLKVLSGGVANNTEMNYSVGLNITGGTANGVTMKEFCSISVSDGGVLNNLITDNTGGIVWVENGTVNQAVLLGNDDDDVDLVLASGGAANNTAVHYKGELYVSSGAVVSNTEITSGGEMFLHSDGVHRGSMQIGSGAIVSAYRGAEIDFSLADKTAGNDYLINDLSLIRGTPTYTITVSADQADGCYKLAQGADSFTGTITIGTETESYGTLTVNEAALIYNGKQYSLALNGENLQLFISPPDSEAPILEITGNTTAWTNKNVVLTADASDSPSGISSVEYSFNNVSWMEGESVSVSKNGTVYFRAIDKAGNITTKNVIVDKIDKTAPVCGKIALKQTDQNNVKVTISGFTDNVKLARYDVYLNGKKVGSTTGTTYTYKSSANLTAGTSTFAVKAVDSVGNVSATASAKLTVNLAVVGKATSKSTVLTWKAASVSGGRKQYEVVVSGKKYISTTNKITISGLAVGNLPVTVYARSKTNKLTTLDSGDIIKVTDGTAPTGGKVVAAQSGQKNIKVTISGFKDNVKVTKYDVYVNGKKVATTTSTSYTYKSSVNLIGKKTVMVKALDAAGNISAGKSVAITIKDVTAPSKVTGLKVSGTPTQSYAKLVWSKGVDNVGVTKYAVKVSGVSTLYTTTTNSLVVKGLTAGTHTYQVYAYDATGRKSAVSTAYSFNVKDITAPTGGKVVAAQSGQKNINVTISGFKDNVKVAKYYVYVNGTKVATTTSTSYTYKSSVNLIGKKTVMVKALDAAGNISASKSVAITIKDVTAPSKVTGLKVSGTPTQSYAKLVWSKGVDNVGVTKYAVKVSGVSKTYTTTTNSLVVKGLTAGKHTYQVYAYDATGRKSAISTAYSFNVKDITAPTGGKITLKQASQNSVKITISSFKDNVKVAKYYVYVNGTKVATTSSTTYTYTQSANFTTSKLTFAVKAVDSTGNISTAKSAAFAAKVRVSGKATNLSTVLTWTKPSISGTLKRYEITVGGKKYTSTTNKITIKGLAVGTNSVTINAINTSNQSKTVCSGELIKVVSGAISKTITGLDNKTFESVTRDGYFLPDEDVVGFYNSLPTAAKGGYTTGTAGNDTVTFAANKSCVVTGMSLGAGNDKIVMTDSAKKYAEVSGEYPNMIIGTEIAILRFAGDAKTGIIDMGSGDDSLYLGKNVTLHAEMIMSNDGFLRMGTGNDKITLGAGAILECLDVDLGAGNDTVLLGAGSCMDSNLVNLGDGDDTVRVGKDAELGEEVFFGAGNDKLIIDQGAYLNPWFEAIDNPLDFGAGTDTLVLNGSVMLTDYNRIAGLEKLEGTGTFLINEFDGYDKAQVEGLIQQGFHVINTEDGFSCVRDRQTELADNLRSGAKEIACYPNMGIEWENFWLCGEEKAASLYQGFCDDTDWFKFTMDRAYEGTLDVGLDGINAELYDSDGIKICDVTDEGIELSTFTVGATYYLKATISASDTSGFGSITFASK